MKIRECIEIIIVGVACIIILPVFLLYLLCKIFITPYDYIRYKRSRYQKDYPKKYTWLSAPHMDNEPYTIIKENDLPVEYIKRYDDYDLNGYFIYKDILLVFDEPLFFDKEKEIYLCWIQRDDEDESSEFEEDRDEDNTDDCMTVEGTIEYILGEFHNNVSDHVCNCIVFFYEREYVKKNYEKDGLEKMLALDNFVVYEKGKLAKAIKDFVANH